MDTYKLEVAGLKRELPVCHINDKFSIAAFIMLGDVELTERCAEELLKKVPEFDIILTAECKGIPLAYEMARRSGKTYLVARKSPKLYMTNPLVVDVTSITTAVEQTLCLSEEHVNALGGKSVLLVDDVISTGESMNALVSLCEKAGGKVVCKAAVLAEGDASDRMDITFLQELPLIIRDK